MKKERRGEEKRRKELSKENFQQKCYYELWYFYVQEENAEYMRWLESEQKLDPEASSVISTEYMGTIVFRGIILGYFK